MTIKHKKMEPVYLFTDSRFNQTLPFKAWHLVLSRFSERYRFLHGVSSTGVKEEIIVGYESSWPGSYDQFGKDTSC